MVKKEAELYTKYPADHRHLADRREEERAGSG